MYHGADTLTKGAADVFLLLIQYGTALAGLLIAVTVWMAVRRTNSPLPKPIRVRTVVGAAVVLAASVAYNAWRVFPTWIPPLDGIDGFLVLQLASFLIPLLLTIVMLLFLLAPVRPARAPGAAELVPRTLLSFSSRAGTAVSASVTLAVVLVSILAGMASTPDEYGRFLQYTVHASGNTSGGTTIYGWWFSVPCLAAVAVIVALVVVQLVLISRPPLSTDRDDDISIRKARVRNVLAAATGGLLLHLGTVLMSLYGTSGMRLGLQAGEAGMVSLGTPFAAIGPALHVASYISAGLGFALWWAVLFFALKLRVVRPASLASA
jgi:uncharacterized membrane protein